MICPNCNKTIPDDDIRICDCGLVFYLQHTATSPEWYCAHLSIRIEDKLYILEWNIDRKSIHCYCYNTKRGVLLHCQFNLPLSSNWNADKLAKFLVLL